MKLLSLIFPPKCMFCGKILKAGLEEVCEPCMDRIMLSGHMPKKHSGAFFDSAVCALEYEGSVRAALHRFKFSGKQSYAKPFARILRFAMQQKQFEDYEIIACVPTNRKNMRKRGYNHAELLAQQLSVMTGKPYVDALAKSRDTKPMFGLNIAQRRANVLGSFALKCDAKIVAGKRVLVVDDILTTGATMSECARILLENGAQAVLAAAVATVSKKQRR